MMDPSKLKRVAVVRFSAAVLVLGALLFGSAGTMRYWHAWVYLAVVLLPMILHLWYLAKHDPALLERRIKAREVRQKQTTLQKLGAVIWLAIFLVPGLDQRFGWSSVPWQLVAASNLLILGGHWLFFRVMKANSYASRIIEVHEGQTVITTGPYALVRHPMYVAATAMMLFTTIALDSYWALVPAFCILVTIVVRILDEEKMLLEELPEYREYIQRTPHRLIPGIW